MAILQRETNSNMNINVIGGSAEQPMTYKTLLHQFLLFSFVFLSVTITVIQLLQIEELSLYFLLVGPFIIGLHLYVKEKWKKSYVIYSTLVIQLLSIIWWKTSVINGLFITVNEFADKLGRHTSVFIHPYELTIDPSTYSLAVNVFWIQLSILLAMVILFLLEKNLSLLLFFMVILLYSFQLVTGIHVSSYVNALLFVVMLLSIHYFFVNREHIHEQMSGRHNGLILSILLGIVILTMLVTFALSSSQLFANIDKPSFIMNLEESILEPYYNVRFGKNDIHLLSEGKLSSLESLELTDEEALEVVMSEPNSYYLRGFVGAKYVGNAWENLDYESMYENYNLFYWLDKEGLSPLTQLSLVHELGSEDSEHSRNEMTIHHKGASRHYMYTPYELNGELNIDDELHYYNENNLRSHQFFGHRDYSYEASSNLVKYYPRITNRLYEAYENVAVKRYLELESHYNEFVYNYYTQLTDDVTSFYADHIDKDAIAEEKRISYEEAIEFVQDHLSHLLRYEENVRQVPKDQDFVTYIFESLQAGYAPHYATVATTMFRYLGVPSRYVEGYLVTPNMIENKQPYEKIPVTGKEAHAWTEIYIDEVGWIPLEFTPGYEDTMEAIDMSEYPKGKWSDHMDRQLLSDKTKKKATESNDSDSVTVESIDDDIDEQIPDESLTNEETGTDQDGSGDGSDGDTGDGSGQDNGGGADDSSSDQSVTEDPEDDRFNIWKLLLYILLFIVLLLLLAYLIYLIKKRLELRKLKKSFYGTDVNNAVIKLFSYTLLLFHYDGVTERKGSTYKYVQEVNDTYGAKYGNNLKEVITIAQAAAYSNRTLMKEEYEKVLHYQEDILTKVKESKNIFQKIKMKCWDFIY